MTVSFFFAFQSVSVYPSIHLSKSIFFSLLPFLHIHILITYSSYTPSLSLSLSPVTCVNVSLEQVIHRSFWLSIFQHLKMVYPLAHSSTQQKSKAQVRHTKNWLSKKIHSHLPLTLDTQHTAAISTPDVEMTTKDWKVSGRRWWRVYYLSSTQDKESTAKIYGLQSLRLAKKNYHCINLKGTLVSSLTINVTENRVTVFKFRLRNLCLLQINSQE